jgi:MFS family permease
MMAAKRPHCQSPARLPAGVWALGFVSLLMDVSSEMIHALLPLFLVGTLGASAVLVGLIEGTAEATALCVRLFSGWLSDHWRRRKGLALLGYGVGAAVKPLFALALSPAWVFLARILDRLGKGIRGAPRDALVADLVPASQRGAAYGLRQSLDTVGAFCGPLLATGLMVLWANDMRAVFWVAAIPGALAVLVLALGVRESPQAGLPIAGSKAPPWRRELLAQLPRTYWWVVGVAVVFTLARFSESFLVLRAHELGVPLAFVPLVMVAMSAVFALTAYPFGRLADRMPARPLLVAGLLVLVLADVVLAMATGWGVMLLGVGLWGLHMGMTQGLLAAMVANTAPEALRGSAFGVLGMATGVAILMASVLAGVLWEWVGSRWTFTAGALFALVAAGMLLRPQRAY